ncbi:MAG: KGK domain-containing protein [Planktothrix sp.]
MDNNCQILDYDEVVQIEEPLRILSNDPTCKIGEVIAALMSLLKPAPPHNWKTPAQNPEQQGIQAQVLTYEAKGWQKGRIRIRIEFCPDEPEVEEIAAPQEPESVNEPDSPLDEIRRMIDEPNS